ncbi:MAG: hypothetical protein ACK5AL_06815 [Planctomycetota bacterium]
MAAACAARPDAGATAPAAAAPGCAEPFAGAGLAWTAAAPGATAPAAVVVASAAAWRHACQRLGLQPEHAPGGWSAFAGGAGLVIVTPPGHCLDRPPVLGDEEGVEVWTVTAAADGGRVAVAYAWSLPAGARRRAIVYRDDAVAMAGERVLWIDPP